ncbi:hypothetical protein [Methylobacterium sp. NEAU K]|nr:hypothetical protein [Methylobacterium sp. NEAU K]MDP4006571.1 hypothetical protein [Methylobacterium sp. NEAU K]
MSSLPRRPLSSLRDLFTSATGGLVLTASAALALAVANSPRAPAHAHPP